MSYSMSSTITKQNTTAPKQLARGLWRGAALGLFLFGILWLFSGCGGTIPCNGGCADGFVCQEDQCVVDCGTDKVACDNQCIDAQTNTDHCGKCGSQCKAGQTCEEGVCKTTCAEKETLCGEACIDIQSNLEHCGACDNKCASKEECNNGQCETKSPCSSEQTECGGQCIDTNSDDNHCGACDNSCGTDKVCDQGSCKCKTDKAECDDGTGATVCVDTDSNSKHCGACGTACKDGEECKSGTCEVSCAKEETACDGTCVTTDSSNEHCGSCNNKCEGKLTCVKGSCECPADRIRCGTTCVDAQSDPQNCGQCTDACTTQPVCSKGKCEAACPSTLTNCSNACVDLQSHRGHCGACGTQCKGELQCIKGVCGCPSGETECNGKCANLQNNAKNCGTCGQACKPGEVCSKGSCKSQCATDQKLCGGVCINTQTNNKHCGACGSTCSTDQTCCTSSCASLQTDTNNCGSCGNACQSGHVCKKGKCEPPCPTGQTECNGKCIDLKNDANNCGACGNTCGSGKVCCDGGCVDTTYNNNHCGVCNKACTSGSLCCAGGCVDTQTDDKNCGNCGVACGGGRVCTQGQCACGTSKTICSGSCVDLQTDSNHCGRCGTQCGNGKTCYKGVCVTACTSSQIRCNGVCINPKTNPDHCGTCGTVCSSSQVCNTGSCTTTCSSNLRVCSRICVDTRSNNKHCGGCGKSCSSGKECYSSSCVTACTSSQARCSGTCKNIKSDPDHCGKCGTVCRSNQVCTAGACSSTCSSGKTVCSRKCVDLQSDNKNCGSCGKVCSSGAPCRYGVCVTQWAVKLPSTSNTITSIAANNKRNIYATGSNSSSPGLLLYKVDSSKRVTNLSVAADAPVGGFHAQLTKDIKYTTNSGKKVGDTGSVWSTSNSGNLHNAKSNFNTANGTFTVPTNGYYYVQAQLDVEGLTGTNSHYFILRLYVGGNPVLYSQIGDSSHNVFHHHLEGIIYLKKGEKVTLQTAANGARSYTLKSGGGFSAFFLSSAPTSGFHARWVTNVSRRYSGWYQYNSSGRGLWFTGVPGGYNQGGNFNTSRGEYTAPATGYYYFNVNTWLEDVETRGLYRLFLLIDNDSSSNYGLRAAHYNYNYKKRFQLRTSGTVFLTKGQKITVKIHSPDRSYTIKNIGTFSGYYLGPKLKSGFHATLLKDQTTSTITKRFGRGDWKTSGVKGLYTTSDFDTGLGVYTVPQTGYYYVHSQIYLTYSTISRTNKFSLEFIRNLRSLGGFTVSSNMVNQGTLLTTSGATYFKKGDEIKVMLRYDKPVGSNTTYTIRKESGFSINYLDIERSQVTSEKVASDNSDNVSIAGQLTGSMTLGSKKLGMDVTPTIYVARRSSSSWSFAKRLHSGTLYGLDTDGSNNTYACTTFSGTWNYASGKSVKAIKTDGAVVKLNSSGTVQWVAHIQSKSSSPYHIKHNPRIKAAASGAVYLAGVHEEAVTLGRFNLKHPGRINRNVRYLSRIKADGSFEWVKAFYHTGIGIHSWHKLAVDSSENVYVAGYYGTKVTFGSQTFTGQRGNNFVAKYDKSGNLKWATEVKFNSQSSNFRSSQTITGLEVDRKGTVYITGYGSGTTIGSQSTSSRTYVASLNSKGQVLWLKGIAPHSTLLTHDGLDNFYLNGSFGSSSVSLGSVSISGSSGKDTDFIAKNLP